MHYKDHSFSQTDLASATEFTEVLARLPSNVGLGGDGQGNGVGTGWLSHMAALGEFVERRHFAHLVRTHASVAVGTQADRPLASSLLRAFRQTSGLDDAAIELAVLGHTICRSLVDGREVSLPTCLVATPPEVSALEAKILPVRDSSGCAAHSSARLSHDSALREFIERQTFIVHWIRRDLGVELTGVAKLFAGDRLMSSTYGFLARSGTVRCFLMQLEGNAYTIFSCFEAGDAAHVVQFACGLACHWDAKSALRKSVLELWHSYVAVPMKMNSLSSGRHVGRLDRYFLGYNHPRSFSQSAWGANAGPTARVVDARLLDELEVIDVEDGIAGLAAVSPHLFWYVAMDCYERRSFVVSKVFSPDFFLHIDLSTALNYANALSDFTELDYAKFDFRPTCLP